MKTVIKMIIPLPIVSWVVGDTLRIVSWMVGDTRVVVMMMAVTTVVMMALVPLRGLWWNLWWKPQSHYRKGVVILLTLLPLQSAMSPNLGTLSVPNAKYKPKMFMRISIVRVRFVSIYCVSQAILTQYTPSRV